MRMVITLILGMIVGSYLGEYLRNKRIYMELKYINRYLKILDMDYVRIKHKNKVFHIVVDSLIDDPIYKKLLYINEELVLTGYELNHGYTNSRQLEYNGDRSEYEINKLRRLAYKKLKKLHYNKCLKVDYSFTSFWED